MFSLYQIFYLYLKQKLIELFLIPGPLKTFQLLTRRQRIGRTLRNVLSKSVLRLTPFLAHSQSPPCILLSQAFSTTVKVGIVL